jgi:UDP-N-acetyl-D-glucosamine 4,6-dehydratase
LKLFNLKKEYDKIKLNYKTQINVNFKLGNLSNDFFLKKIFLDEKNIDGVLHAAAYKHVGLGEDNTISFVKNNVFVTYNLAKISILRNVKKFIFISTDKAVNPKSVMGYTKSICEKILINFNKKYNLKNVFKIVRFGNVINSDGSVLPIFEKQILNGGPLTVTNKDVSRYFMSIKNACELVLHTVEIDKKIGLFILDMGKSYKILAIAKSMINFYLKKKKLVTKPKIIFIGLQKGEKVYEELILGKNLKKTKIKNILTANEKVNSEIDYAIIVEKFKKSYIQNNDKKILYYLKKYA